MLLIERRYIQHIRSAARREDLYDSLQGAIELEHATIPPYLTAIFSLHPGKNNEIRDVLRSVVVEEMLHLAIAANTLNAIHGAPSLNRESFIPRYPSALPMNMGEGLAVGLEHYSTRLIRDVFMMIEQPETPLHFPAEPDAPEEREYGTIGEFYSALMAKIRELGNGIFTGDPARQVVDERRFPADELFAIHDVESAVRGLKLVVSQGEGTTESPLAPEGELAHYYRFEELCRGRRLVADSNAEKGYSFSGETIPFDAEAVYPLKANTKARDLPDGGEARRAADELNQVYAKLLDALHRTFNGEPAVLDEAMGLMGALKRSGERVAAIPYPGLEGATTGPPFEYVRPQ